MTETPSQRSLEAAAELISQADALIITAGAGMGVDSGLPDFRSKDGFWKAYPALGWDEPSIVGLRIKALREELGLSQEKIGVAIGIDESSSRARISRYELGVHEPSQAHC